MDLQQLKKIAAFYARFTLSFTQVGYRARRLFWPSTKTDFTGQHWLVTGASGGLGRQIVLAAAQAGARVTAAARSAEKLAQLVADGSSKGIAGIDVEPWDFSPQSDTVRLLRKLVGAGRAIHVPVNNVGVLNDDHFLTSEGSTRALRPPFPERATARLPWHLPESRTEVRVFDVPEPRHGPPCRVGQPQRVAHGFLATWVSAAPLAPPPSPAGRE